MVVELNITWSLAQWHQNWRRVKITVWATLTLFPWGQLFTDFKQYNTFCWYLVEYLLGLLFSNTVEIKEARKAELVTHTWAKCCLNRETCVFKTCVKTYGKTFVPLLDWSCCPAWHMEGGEKIGSPYWMACAHHMLLLGEMGERCK